VNAILPLITAQLESSRIGATDGEIDQRATVGFLSNEQVFARGRSTLVETAMTAEKAKARAFCPKTVALTLASSLRSILIGVRVRRPTLNLESNAGSELIRYSFFSAYACDPQFRGVHEIEYP
jgi:hypothetical protein